MLRRCPISIYELRTSHRSTPHRFRTYIRVTSKTGVSQYYPKTNRPCQILQSSSSIATVLIVLATTSVLGGAFLFLKPAKAPYNSHTSSVPESAPSMPTNALPGRSGNLTPEQELKLQEFWTALLRLTGVSLPNEPLPNGRSALREAAQQRDRADSSDSAKKKHSRLQSMFSRKKEGVSDDDSSRAGSSEDKYGQEKDFQTVLASVSPVELRKALWSMAKSDDPDDLMLRFLRARKWNVHNALVMLISTIHWRLEFRVDDDIMRNGEHGAILDQASSDPIRQKRGKDFIFQLEKGKSFVHGTDREGRPMCFVRTRLHRAADQDPSALDRTTVYVIETARLTLLPPVDTATVVFDMTDFSMANMVLPPSHSSFLPFASPEHYSSQLPVLIRVLGLQPRKIHDQNLRSQLP